MKPTKIENAIIVRNKTRLEQLTAQYNTIDQAKFYIKKSQEVYKQKKESSLGFKSEFENNKTAFSNQENTIN